MKVINKRMLFIVLIIVSGIILSVTSVCMAEGVRGMPRIVTDVEPPIIQSFSIDKHSVLPGDTVTVTAVLTDESGIGQYFYIGFYDSKSLARTVYLYDQGNGVYQGSLTITSDFVNGKHSAEWIHLEDIHGNGGTDYSSDSKYPELYFIVYDSIVDNKSPVVEQIQINKTIVVPGDVVVVTATLSDQSEIKSTPYIGFYDSKSKARTMYLYKQSDGSYKGELKITPDFVNGKYTAAWLQLEDIHGNGGTDYEFDNKHTNIYFEVTNAITDTNPPVIESIEISQNHVTELDKVKVKAAFSDESGIGSAYIGFYKRNSQSRNMDLIKQSDGTYVGEMDITSDFVVGKHDAAWFHLEDVHGNGGTDYSFETKYPHMYIMVCADPIEVVDIAVKPTCEQNGLTQGSHCMTCGEIIQKQENIPQLGHDWDAPQYTWSEDNYYVTAKRVCLRNELHSESETVATVATVVEPAAPGREGLMEYTTEAFSSTAYLPQKKRIKVPALPMETPEPTPMPDDSPNGDIVHGESDFSKLPAIKVPVLILPDGTVHELDLTLKFNGPDKEGKNNVKYDVRLIDSNGNKVKLPEGCMLCFPYPEGMNETNALRYRIMIHHFGDKGMEKFDTKDGTIKLTPQGLCIRVSSLSPFVITWEEIETNLPQTGDSTPLLLYGAGALLSLTAIGLLKRKTKRT